MEVVQPFKYRHLFDDSRPIVEELLKETSSITVITMMAAINDTLIIKGNEMSTQSFILEAICFSFDRATSNEIRFRAERQFANNCKLFGLHFTVELVNRELSCYKEDNVQRKEDDASDTLKILKAYLSLVEEMMEKEQSQFEKEKVRLGGDAPHLQLMWSHLVKQHEFVARPDPMYEALRGFAFVQYLETHPEYEVFAKRWFNSLECRSGYEYLTRYAQLVTYHLNRKESPKPGDYFLRIRLPSEQLVLKSLTIEPEELRNNKRKQIDYRGMKERPLLQIGPTELTVPFWYFLYNALFNGLFFAFYRDSGVASLFKKKAGQEKDSGLMIFRSRIGEHFSEAILFRGMMTKCLQRDGTSLRFEFEKSKSFNPDCYHRCGNHLFLIEFKDNLLNSDTIQSGSYEQIREAVDTKFVQYKDRKTGEPVDIGIYQLARNIEIMATVPDTLWSVDELAKREGLALADIILHPIIVQTNNYFDLPGIGEYLNEKIQDRLDPVRSSFKSIEPFTIINFSYFFDRFLLFADAKILLEDELYSYHTMIKRRKENAAKTGRIQEQMKSFSPFAAESSPGYEKYRNYRRGDLYVEIRKMWNIEVPNNLS